MREASRLRSWRRGVGALATAAVLALPAMATAAVAPDKKADAGRNYDARVELNQAVQTAPAAGQLQAVEALKREMPDLGVSFDEATGVTRTLQNYVGFLSAPQAGDAAAIGLGYVRANLALLGLGEADLADMETTDTVYSAVSGVTYVYLRQRQDGLPLYNGQLHFGVTRDGRVLMVNNQFLPGLAAAVNATRPSLSAADAVLSAAQHLGMEAATPQARGEGQGLQQVTLLDAAGFSAEPVEAKLMLLPIRQGEARLVWNFAVHTLDSQHVYDMNVDAVDGRVWTRFDWVSADTYRVYDRPVESPIHTVPAPPADARTLVLNPANLPASPFGWHDTDGVVGAEFTTTQGNNVHAYTDIDANNLPDAGSSPDGTAALVFSFPLDLTQPPAAYRPAAVTNLFHWNNIIHDIQHRYGFDAVAGNFQVNQYGGGGLGNDDVRAEAQDGAGTNNANFFTPVDGQRPRMQMFLGSNPTPDVDGDLDNLVIVHEYGHGISNRLVGGPNNVSCLSNAQQPGEGLSDWWGLFYTTEIGDQGTDRRTVGNYLFGQPVSGPGIRGLPYSTDPAINTWTYQSMQGMAVPHGVGSIWAQGYWEIHWRLVAQYGFDINLYNATGGAGNQRANLYLNEGLKATICSPAFTNVRDGVIAAATAINGGADVCRLWAGFAAYGLGVNAVSGGPSSTSPTNGFLLPTACLPVGPSNLTATATAPNRITVNWTASPGAVTYRLYRANGACPQPTASFVQIATGLTGTTFDDNTVSGGLTYAYVVTAFDANGIESQFSNCDDAVATGGCTTPPTFAGVTSATSAGTTACAVNVAWNAATPVCPGTTVKYNVYRSTTAGTPPSAATLRQSCVTTLNFTDTSVTSGTRYYYVVRAEDSLTGGTGACNSGNQDANVIERNAVPGGPVTTVTDDVESGGGNWNTTGGSGANVWTIVSTQSNSPTRSWFVADPAVVTLQPLRRIAAVNVPAGGVLSWFHRVDSEPNFDGYVVEYSLDGGMTWSDILLGQGTVPANPNRFLQNGYNSTLNTGFGNPLPGRRAWSGTILTFQQVRVDLADFSGRDVTLRYRFGSDDSVSDQGVWIDDISFATSTTCNTIPTQAAAPQALAIDTAGNGVFQPNETVVMAPTWRNTGATAIALTGSIANHTGPAGPTYGTPDTTADYGTIAISGQSSCTSTANCYAVSNTAATRPATHWDSTVVETVTPTAATKTWTLHIGDSFTDVLPSSPFYRFVETILHKNVTGGCTLTAYCPADSTTREQMAVFVLVSREPVGYAPVACGATPMFADVPVTSPFCRWVEELARRGVVTGCGGGNYCPGSPATREQMAVFVLRTLDPALNPPACGTPMFADVPASSPFCRWIEELARRAVVTGCGGGNYCPAANVSREQMSVFLAVTFGIPLYGL